ncbi:MAG: hypothetical protein Q9216_003215 [Gyalolechia sp. 2 TL-2023]
MAFAAVLEEISILPRAARVQIPVSNSLFDLSERSHSSKGIRLEVSCALFCACQLSHFIGYYEQQAGTLPMLEDDVIIGLGLGQLSAAAVVCSRTLVDLIKVAVYAVRLAFRTGAVVGAMSHRSETQHKSEGSWSTLVSTPADVFQTELEVVQDRLNSCSGDISSVGLWHASRLYSQREVSGILEPLLDILNDIPQPFRTSFSPAKGKSVKVETAKELFGIAINDILRTPLQWPLLEHFLASTINRSPILSFEFSVATKALLPLAATDSGDREMKFRDLAGWCSSINPQEDQNRHKNIAIVGMSCRFPGADNVEQLWDILEQGRDTYMRIPKDRFEVDTHYDPQGKKTNASHTPYGCFIEKPGLFDPRFFSMSPREATETDPMHRLALVTAYEALEMAGFVLNATPSTQQDRVGTFYGQTCDDWREVNAAQNIETYFIPGGVRAFAPGRINFHFGFRGPSYSVDTACSSSLAAVQIACQSLIAGGCDTAVTGGVNILTAPDIFAGLSKGQFLSKTGSCKTWDIGADGYCRADGVGSVILKREEDAIMDNDNILGVILASGTNHSADAISITHPHAGNQADLYQSILHDAGINPLDVSYVEMHGTGTQAGDTNEMESVTKVFAPLVDGRDGSSEQALHIGAVKSNVGHGEAAAGMAALMKVLVMMQKNAIPLHIGIKTKLNPKFSDLQSRNVQIPFTRTSWQRQEGQRRIAFVNNFSAAGGNTALLLRDHPTRKVSSSVDPRPTLPFVISAKSLSSLQKNVRQLLFFLADGFPDNSLASLSYTLTTRRMHHNYRISAAAPNLDNLQTSLLTRLNEGNFSPISSRPPQIAFVLTGQGAFYPSLGRGLYSSSALFRTEISRLNEMTIAQGLPSFLPAIDGSLDEHKLSASVTQLALVCVQMALVELWASWGIRPSAVIGHSLGEYAALCAAGVLSKDDTIHLVGHRARLLEEHCTPNTHQMLVIKASLAEVTRVNGDVPYEVACINSPDETVICGSVDHMAKSALNLKQAGFKCLIMDLPYAFHSLQVEPILTEFEGLAAGAIFHKPTIPVVSSFLGRLVDTDGVFSPKYLSDHARAPVNFLGAVRAAADAGVFDPKRTIFVEIGAHPVCTAMIRSSLDSDFLGVPSLHKAEDAWKTLSNSLCSLFSTGLDIDWRQFHLQYDSSHELLVLPAYCFDNKNYWIDYVNDWCLHKTEPRVLHHTTEPAQPISKLSTSSVHYISSEVVEGNTCTVVAQSDLSSSILRNAVLGHSVNGIGLCPSSIYADIAMTLGDYVYKQLKPSSDNTIGIQCGNMEVVKPLIVKERSSEPQILQITITASLETSMGHLRYVSIDSQGKETMLHATCIVTFEDGASWLSDWAPTAYLIQGRIDTLEKRLTDGKADRISRGLAYKMFAALVQYDRRYQGMENVTLDSSNFEATSRVNFQTKDEDGSFFCSPFWIDSLAHLSGFVLNGSDAVDSKKYVYISHGWKSLRFGRPLSSTTIYRSYVKMQPSPNNVMVGDVFILEDSTIIGVVGGLKFQRVPRAMLDTLLPSESPIAKASTTGHQAIPPSTGSPVAKAKDGPYAPSQLRATPPKKDTPPQSDLFAKALDIISHETDLPLSELLDDCLFADLGVDSLLSLQITGKMREAFDVDVPSTVFIDHPTIGDLQSYLSHTGLGVSSSTPSSSLSSPDEEQDGYDDGTSDSSISSFQAVKLTVSHTPMENSSAIMKSFRTTIAEQMGVEVEEIVGSNDLLSLGLDSLMTIVILGILREQTGLDLPSDLFLQHPSIDAIQNFLGSTTPEPPRKNGKSSQVGKKKQLITTPPTPPAQAVSILIQGRPKNAAKVLYLMPDGSGSATSYASIPDIDRRITVYALNSPFMTIPAAFTNGIAGIASLYIAEIRRRQPHGPYHLGGWSAGGVVAYEMTLQLLSMGESVESLILLDSPCPIRLEPLPSRLHHFFADIGLLGGEGQEIPPWLLPHFEASIKALAEYEPGSIKDEALAPRVLAIWARHGVCRYPDDPRPPASLPHEEDPKSMTWLLENRTDFGFNEWDALVGAEAIETTSLEGNHFTLMKEPEQMARLATMIRDFLL